MGPAVPRAGSLPQWLPDDGGLVAPVPAGTGWIHRQGDKWWRDEVPLLGDLGNEVAYVIGW